MKRMAFLVIMLIFIACLWKQPQWWDTQEAGARVSLINDGYYQLKL